jgi:hypothetical protein
MKLDPRISAELARLEPNQIGVMAWSLMANPTFEGGVPGQPDPDPAPGQSDQPDEQGVPTLPDEPPPAPVA